MNKMRYLRRAGENPTGFSATSRKLPGVIISPKLLSSALPRGWKQTPPWWSGQRFGRSDSAVFRTRRSESHRPWAGCQTGLLVSYAVTRQKLAQSHDRPHQVLWFPLHASQCTLLISRTYLAVTVCVKKTILLSLLSHQKAGDMPNAILSQHIIYYAEIRK